LVAILRNGELVSGEDLVGAHIEEGALSLLVDLDQAAGGDPLGGADAVALFSGVVVLVFGG
jgi:hypothetical protein